MAAVCSLLPGVPFWPLHPQSLASVSMMEKPGLPQASWKKGVCAVTSPSPPAAQWKHLTLKGAGTNSGDASIRSGEYMDVFYWRVQGETG